MAGRGTDIKPDPDVLERGGLHVILTEFHESIRIDRQLFGRFAPALRALCAGAMVRTGRLPGWMLKLLVWRVQEHAERYNRGIRLMTMKQDKKLQESLGFAGTKR